MSDFERVLYLIVLLSTALATFVLLAPTPTTASLPPRTQGGGRSVHEPLDPGRLGFLAFAMVGACCSSRTCSSASRPPS